MLDCTLLIKKNNKKVCNKIDDLFSNTGRTHRSNQVTAPEYVFLISELAGEQRFASIVAKRLESLVRMLISYFS